MSPRVSYFLTVQSRKAVSALGWCRPSVRVPETQNAPCGRSAGEGLRAGVARLGCAALQSQLLELQGALVGVKAVRHDDGVRPRRTSRPVCDHVAIVATTTKRRTLRPIYDRGDRPEQRVFGQRIAASGAQKRPVARTAVMRDRDVFSCRLT
eukprot:scaffold13914_cov69-Phaeocystis_antarctica.AAC.1